MPGVAETVVYKTAMKNGGIENERLRKYETYREAALLFDLMAQYPDASVRLYGLCEDGTSGISIVMEKLKICGFDDMRNWTQTAGEDEVKLQLRRYIERNSKFVAGELSMRDLKWTNVGINKGGQLHALDAGDFEIQMGATRSHAPKIDVLGYTIHFAQPHTAALANLPSTAKQANSRLGPCPRARPIHLPMEACFGLRDVRLLGSGRTGVLWEAQLPGVDSAVVRKTAPSGNNSWGLQRFEMYREATMLADLQAHYGANETAHLYGVCDNTVGDRFGMVSIVREKLDDVRARWVSCLLEKAWTPNGWASLNELRHHGCHARL